jgi:hypothetical protein
MYRVDERDRVVPLADVPQSSVGAPTPLVVADERRVILAYYVEEHEAGWDGSVRMVGPIGSNEAVALVQFNLCEAHMFGPPNDEAFAGHPLAGRGLQPYGVFRIDDSSWIRQLECMNSVHPRHRAERFWQLQHLVFAFHDYTFECVCREFDVRSERGSISEVVPRMVEMLEWRGNDSSE